MTERPVYVQSAYSIVGPKEGDGDFGACFDTVLADDLWGERSYEKAESKMHREAIRGAVCLAGTELGDTDIMLAGDLLNEISASSLAMRYFKVPFLGLYNACSTFSEAVLTGAALIDGGAAERVTCSTSSHFASAERQYRYPLELGNQRTPTSQWTVTGAGCTVLGSAPPDEEQIAASRENFKKIMRAMRDECVSEEKERDCKNGSADDGDIYSSRCERLMRKIGKKFRKAWLPESVCEPVCDPTYTRTHIVRIAGGTFGKVTDFGLRDESNMGAAMAPAAADTLLAHFKDFGRSASDYDAIFTGDLGRFGKEALDYLLKKEGIDLGCRYDDCGALYFKPEQETFQGGSGAGCVSTFFNGVIVKRLERGELRRVLVLATGALLNKDTPLQRETIPGVSHAFVAESVPLAEVLKER